MDRLTTGKACETYTAQLKRKGHTIGFIPTMGCLHEGHLSLIKRSLEENDETIVSIYINPTQFEGNEDFSNYPRKIRQDIKLLTPLGITAVYTPKDKDIYGNQLPDEHTKVSVPNMGEYGCGKSRPKFFDGITTVLYKLFRQVQPTTVYLGEKDFQQCKIVEKLVEDLELNLTITMCETVREENGLAKSSRNNNFIEKELEEASKIYQHLKKAKEATTKNRSIKEIITETKANLEKIKNFELDYLECIYEQRLTPSENLEKPTRLICGGYLNKVRLIDNIKLS